MAVLVVFFLSSDPIAGMSDFSNKPVTFCIYVKEVARAARAKRTPLRGTGQRVSGDLLTLTKKLT